MGKGDREWRGEQVVGGEGKVIEEVDYLIIVALPVSLFIRVSVQHCVH